MNNNYIKFCDQLHKDWFEGKFDNDPVLSKLFQLEYSPEPYFTITENEGDNPLYMLLTNPGGGMDFQHRSNFQNSNYKEFSSTLGKTYTSESFKSYAANAFRRNEKSIALTKSLGYSGLKNIETIPFHSADLNKQKALKCINDSDLLNEYLEELKAYISDKPLLVVSACSSRESITAETVRKSVWLSFQAELIGIDINNADLVPLKYKEGKLTSAVFKSGDKYLLLNMGTNNLPNISKDKINLLR